jgi:hypothetical protein
VPSRGVFRGLRHIVGRDEDRFVFRGDNNNFLDPAHPGRTELVGKLWVSGPLVGVAVVGGLAAVLLLGADATRRRRRVRRSPVSVTSAPLAAAPPSSILPALPPAPTDKPHDFAAWTTADLAAGQPASGAADCASAPALAAPPAPAASASAATEARDCASAPALAAPPAPAASASAATEARPTVLPQPTWLTPRARPIPPAGCGLPVVLPQPRPFTPPTISAPVAPPLPVVTEPARSEEPVVERPAPMPRARILDRRRILLGAAVAAALFALLALFAFARPTTKSVAVKTPYREAVTLGYYAAVPPKAGPVYPSGSLSTGDPVFLRLTSRVQVTMGYRLTADAPHTLSGATDMVLRLSSPSGWTRELPLAPEMPFEGGRADRVATLDLDQIRKLTRRVERLTGVAAGSYSIAVVPRVHATGTVAGQPLRTDFSPQATFELDALELRPSKGGEQARPSAVTSTRSAQNTISLRGHSLPVATLRWIALAGLAIAALAALVALLPCFRRPRTRTGAPTPATAT